MGRSGVLLSADRFHRHARRPRGDLGVGPRPAPLDDEADAIARVNGSEYGLADSVWTPGIVSACRTARAVRSGTVFINMSTLVDATAPWAWDPAGSHLPALSRRLAFRAPEA
ncbi:aldehyde dehydrogenase family protein [Streptomyces sp. NPDC006872]|uniref:aldehyde dehydrogenase family protein n=1 Tax=Streptomyces sp. NPDC006872 TaxID=3155720 RepID=UPI00340A2119